MNKKYKNADEYAKQSLGLNELEITIVKQKKAIVEKLIEARQQLGITQSKLAKKIGSTQPAIARMESGLIAEVSFDFIARCAIEMGVFIMIGAVNKAA